MAVLSLEAVVVILAIPVVAVVGTIPVPVWAAIVGGLALAVALLVVARSLARPWAVPAGWVLQVLIIATGILAPAMFIVGGIFAVLWGVAVRLGRQVDEGRAGNPG